MDDSQKEILEAILKYVVVPVKEKDCGLSNKVVKDFSNNYNKGSSNNVLNKKNSVRNNNDNNKNENNKVKKLKNNDSLLDSSSIDSLLNGIVKKNKTKNTNIHSIVVEEELSLSHKKKTTVVNYSGAVSDTSGESTDNVGYRVEVYYESNDIEETLKIVLSDYEKITGKEEETKDKKKKPSNYEITIKKKHEKTEDLKSSNYKINVVYETNYEEERLNVVYKESIGQYLNKRDVAFNDFTDRVPGKTVDIFPESIMGGVLGFTYLGDNYMALREDIRDDTSGQKLMVDVHESIHTPDEYETRILTDWILQRKADNKYIR